MKTQEASILLVPICSSSTRPTARMSSHEVSPAFSFLGSAIETPRRRSAMFSSFFFLEQSLNLVGELPKATMPRF